MNNPTFGNDVMQGANFDPLSHDCAGGTSYAPVTFTFSSTMQYFGVYGLSNNNIFLTNANGSVVEFAAYDQTSTLVGFTDAIGFTSVTVSADINGAFVIDDMSFEASAVPEPASAVLMLTGLLGIGVVARRKRARE